MDIRITQTYSQIGIETQRAQINLRNNGKLDFQLSHTNPQLQIETTPPQLHIDQTKSFADAGLKNIEDFASEATGLGKQAVMEFIQNKVQQGNRYADILNKGNAFVEVIRQNLDNTHEFNIALMPEHGPDIYAEPGKVETNLVRGEINAEFNNVPIEQEFIPPEIKIYLQQEGSVTIEYVGNNLDTKV